MSAEKKVISLLLALIILISICVYTKLPEFMQEENSSKIPEAQKTEILSSENNIDIKTETSEKSTSVSTEEVSEELKKEEKELASDTSEDVVVDEVIVENEVPEIPLITTDKRYIRTADEKNIEELSKNTQELQIKIRDYVRENPVSFKRASYTLTNNSNKTIEMIVEILNEYANLKIEVAGHTDAAGAAKLNQRISLKRAETVKDKLISAGIDISRIIVRGYGEDIPLVKNSPNGYSKINRRVEFNIVEE